MDIAQANKIAAETVKRFGYPKKYPQPKLHISNVRRGHCRYETGYISIPAWVNFYSEAYAQSYVIHEVCHLIAVHQHNSYTHDATFKRIEKRALKPYGITIKHGKAYASTLSLNGEPQSKPK